MRTETPSEIGAAEVPTELAYRAGDGLEVLLMWDRGGSRLKVVVDDLRTGESFELAAADGKEALDVFRHPFAYAAARGVDYRSETLPGGESVESELAARASSRH